MIYVYITVYHGAYDLPAAPFVSSPYQALRLSIHCRFNNTQYDDQMIAFLYGQRQVTKNVLKTKAR